MPIYADIAVDAPVRPGRTFSYSVPDNMDVTAGHFVLVPFGPKLLHGVVFEITDSSPVDNTRDISRVIVKKTVMSSNALSMARWMSDHYLCTLFQASQLMFPVGLHKRNISWITVGNMVGEVALSESE